MYKRQAIQYGDADVMVAGGTESAICPTGVAGFTGLTALTAEENPMRASIPFDKDRSGFVIGEGSGIVVLEELEHAKARGANIYAELVGYGADVYKRQESKYADWFMVNDWSNIKKKADTRDERFYSFAFIDNMPKLNTNNEEVIQYFCGICENWIKEFDVCLLYTSFTLMKIRSAE